MRAALLLAAVVIAVPAQAQQIDTASNRLELLGDAPAACVFATPTAGNGSNASFTSTGATSARVNITQLVDTTNANSLPSSIELNLPVICNSAHRVIVRSTNGGLTRLGGNQRGSGPFAEFLAYSFGIGWAGQQVAGAVIPVRSSSTPPSQPRAKSACGSPLPQAAGH
jgi:hypothetical protein